MTILISTIIFIFGTAIGSFLSVVLYRLHTKKKGIIFSRSICPACKKTLKWNHLIPVLSFLFLRGKCGYCGKKISSHYVLLELVTGLIFLFTFLHFNFLEGIKSTIDPFSFNYIIDWTTFQTFLFYVIEFTFLICIFFYDLMYKEIPDRLSIPAIAIAIAGVIVFSLVSIPSMLIGGIGIFTFFALQLILSKGKWIGGGDLRLGALIGFLLGWQIGIIALMIAYLLGSIVSIVLLMSKKATRKSAIPFGPFLVTGALLGVFYGNEILNWYLNSLLV